MNVCVNVRECVCVNMHMYVCMHVCVRVLSGGPDYGNRVHSETTDNVTCAFRRSLLSYE